MQAELWFFIHGRRGCRTDAAAVDPVLTVANPPASLRQQRQAECRRWKRRLNKRSADQIGRNPLLHRSQQPVGRHRPVACVSPDLRQLPHQPGKRCRGHDERHLISAGKDCFFGRTAGRRPCGAVTAMGKSRILFGAGPEMGRDAASCLSSERSTAAD